MTNGVVSIMRDGHVIMKIVTGCDGSFAPKLARNIRQRWPMTIGEVYDTALRLKFGTVEHLVVITEEEVKVDDYTSRAEFCAEHPLYAATFRNPAFNPRWEDGFAAFTEIVDL